jgi:hypothetical protein
MQQWGEGSITQDDLVGIADQIYLGYFDLGQQLTAMSPPPTGFERPTKLLVDAVSELFVGYGNA